MAYNIQNLKPATKETARELGRKGGLATAANRAKRKGITNLLKEMMAQPLKDQETIKKLEQMGLETKGLTNEAIILASMISGAMKGNDKMAKMLVEYLGDDKMHEEEIKKLKKENEKIKAEIELMKQTQDEGIEIEDSQNLAKMLELEESNDHEEKDKDDSTSNTTN